jgi:hypothetical protein
MMSHASKKYSLIICLFTASFFSLCSKKKPVTRIDFTTVESQVKPANKKVDRTKVMEYQMPHIVGRYCKDYNVSTETAKIHERELKRYLILAGESNDSLGMMSTEVDNLWHTFLLFTKEYQAFCNDMFGKFIHHSPKIDIEA